MGTRGIEIKPLSELMQSDPNHLEKLMRLEFMLRQDEPFDEPPAPYSAEKFKSYYMGSDMFYPEGWFIALDGDNYVGWCAVLPDMKNRQQMRSGITVIAREYRRLGLATAMKAHTLQHAQSIGAQRVVTSNASSNPMLQINLRMGFEPLYHSFEYKKTL